MCLFWISSWNKTFLHICLKVNLPSIQFKQLYLVKEEETKDHHDYRQKNDMLIKDVAEHTYRSTGKHDLDLYRSRVGMQRGRQGRQLHVCSEAMKVCQFNLTDKIY